MKKNDSLLGITKKEQIETPSLLIDLEKMESNIQRMADFFLDKKTKLRPHAKTNKSPIIAHKQLAAGSATGITVAKLGEAEVMAKSGIPNIFIANQVVEPSKIARLAGLNRHAKVNVAVDSPNNIDLLDQAADYYKTKISVLVEVDVGLHRCGVQWGEPALKLARYVLGKKNVCFKGLMGYEGHVVLLPEKEERRKLASEAMEKLVNSKDLLVKNGFDVEIVSAGGTGTYDLTGLIDGVTEIEAGSYVFMDNRYEQTGVGFSKALTLYATVISRPSSERAVLDAGLKSVTLEFGQPSVKNHPEWEITSLHEEHAILNIPGGTNQLKPGDKIELFPGHGCTTINLHDRYYALREDRIEAIWSIDARGMFR